MMLFSFLTNRNQRPEFGNLKTITSNEFDEIIVREAVV
jgi:hypothetical protein